MTTDCNCPSDAAEHHPLCFKIAQTNTLSDELVETVAVAIGRADRDKGYEYDHLGIDHPEVSDWSIHLARAALEASGIERIQEEARKRRSSMDSIYLDGAEDVRTAASNMRTAADEMQRAASTIATALEQHQHFMDEWLDRLRSVRRMPECG